MHMYSKFKENGHMYLVAGPHRAPQSLQSDHTRGSNITQPCHGCWTPPGGIQENKDLLGRISPTIPPSSCRTPAWDVVLSNAHHRHPPRWASRLKTGFGQRPPPPHRGDKRKTSVLVLFSKISIAKGSYQYLVYKRNRDSKSIRQSPLNCCAVLANCLPAVLIFLIEWRYSDITKPRLIWGGVWISTGHMHGFIFWKLSRASVPWVQNQGGGRISPDFLGSRANICISCVPIVHPHEKAVEEFLQLGKAHRVEEAGHLQSNWRFCVWVFLRV